MRELLLLRHGLTEANERRIFTGATDIPLSEAGKRMLQESRALYPQAEAYFTSGMLRARQTLAILYGDVPHTDIPELAESNLGAFEGKSHAQLFADNPVYRAWLAEDGDDVVCPGGESRRMFEARVARGWDRLLSHSWKGLAVVITHGGVIRSIIKRAGEGAGESGTSNGSGFRLSLAEDGKVVSCLPFLQGKNGMTT